MSGDIPTGCWTPPSPPWKHRLWPGPGRRRIWQEVLNNKRVPVQKGGGGTFCFFFLVLCLGSCSNVAVENVKLIDFGIRSIAYDKLETTEDPKIERIKIVKSDHFIKPKNRVPATIGTGFDIRFYRGRGTLREGVTLEYAVQHPWLTTPPTMAKLSWNTPISVMLRSARLRALAINLRKNGSLLQGHGIFRFCIRDGSWRRNRSSFTGQVQIRQARGIWKLPRALLALGRGNARKYVKINRIVFFFDQDFVSGPGGCHGRYNQAAFSGNLSDLGHDVVNEIQADKIVGMGG